MYKRQDIDILSRWGGDEFAVVLPHSSCDIAVPIAHRILNAVSAHTFSPLKEWEHPLSVSIGVSGLPNQNVSTALQIVAEADSALARAKRKGRHQIETASGQEMDPPIPS